VQLALKGAWCRAVVTLMARESPQVHKVIASF
jgi:hypothetical protein